MWWVNKMGRIDGPFNSDEIIRRIKLNMLKSLDRVSEDKRQWYYIKDTELWNPTRTILREAPEKSQAVKSAQQTEIKLVKPVLQKDAEYIPPRYQQIKEKPVTPAVDNTIKLGAMIIFATIVCLSITCYTVFMIARQHNHALQGQQALVSKEAEVPSVTVLSEQTSEKESEKASKVEIKLEFKAIKDKVAIIECDEGSGSGFILTMEGKTFLVSNEHVLRSSSTPKASLLDGTILKLGRFYVATDRDLARYEVLDCKKEPLALSDRTPEINEEIAIYGNSDGKGVATELRGPISGIGPDLLEVDCGIVPGNSGSAVLDSSGKVLGVASHLSKSNPENIWIKDTKFEGQIRRFAVRFTKVEWKEIQRREYEHQVSYYEEFKLYWDYLLPYLFSDVDKVEPQRLHFNNLKRKEFDFDELRFADSIERIDSLWEKYSKVVEQYVAYSSQRDGFIDRLVQSGITQASGEKALAEYDAKIAKHAEDVIALYKEYNTIRIEELNKAFKFLSECRWDSPQMKRGYSKEFYRDSIDWYKESIKRCVELIEQRKVDFEKVIKDEEA